MRAGALRDFFKSDTRAPGSRFRISLMNSWNPEDGGGGSRCVTPGRFAADGRSGGWAGEAGSSRGATYLRTKLGKFDNFGP